MFAVIAADSRCSCGPHVRLQILTIRSSAIEPSRQRSLAAVIGLTPAAAAQVTLLPDLSPATVMVCGIQAPSMGRRPPPAEDAAPDAPAPEPVPEPLAREAKHFTEVGVIRNLLLQSAECAGLETVAYRCR